MFKEYRISEIGQVVGGGTPSTTNEIFWDGTIPWISPKDLTGYSSVYISAGEKNITQEGLKSSATQLLPKNTVLFSSRAPIGYLAIAQNEICTNQGFKSIVCNDKIIHYKYLFYYLRANLSYIKLFGTGATFPEISGSAMKRIKITIFDSIKYQTRVSSILSAYDDAIENNNKRIAILEKMASELYKEWFVRMRFPGYETAEYENGLPKGWKIEQLSHIASIIMGQSPESKYYNYDKIGLPFHQGVGTYGDFYLKDEIYSSEGKKIANPNSIIFSVRAPVGRINVNRTKIILGRGVSAINDNNSNNYFLLFALKEYFVNEDIIGNGSIFASVTREQLAKVKILYPNKKIRLLYDNIAKSIVTLLDKFFFENDNLIKQRDLLLPRLMSGKLEV